MLDQLPVAPPPPFVYICALLEEKGYRREDIKQLSRGYINRVLAWPRRRDGTLERPAPLGAMVSREEIIREELVRRNYPAHLMDARVAEMLAEEAQQAAMRRAARQAE